MRALSFRFLAGIALVACSSDHSTVASHADGGGDTSNGGAGVPSAGEGGARAGEGGTGPSGRGGAGARGGDGGTQGSGGMRVDGGTHVDARAPDMDAHFDANPHDSGPKTTGYTLEPVEDDYVRSDIPSVNYGTGPLLVAVADSAMPLTKRSFLRFLVGSGPITSAALELYSTNGSPTGVKIYKTSDTAWTELGTNYDNAPALDGAALAVVDNIPTNGTVSIDVTSAVVAEEPLSLAIVGVSADGVVFNSREATSNHPKLRITTANTSPYSCPACGTGQSCDTTTGRCVCSAPCTTPLRVLQFNILEGAVGNLSNGKPKVDAVFAIIQAVSPDLVSIDEANDEDNFNTLATKTGMSRKLCTATNGYHVGVLSKKPFLSTQCYAMSPITKTVNVVSVAVGTKTVYVYANHTTATGTEAERQAEMTAVLGLAAAYPDNPRIILGDFNSTSRADGSTTGLVTPVLTDGHFVDSYREVHPDVAAFPGFTYVGSTRRIDFLFHDEHFLRATTAEVVTTPAPWPSDHYAVWAEFQLN